MAIKDFDRVFCSSEAPVVNGGSGDHGKSRIIGPLPKDNRFGHFVRLEFLLGIEIENLDTGSGSESDNVLGWRHDGSFSCDGSAGDLSTVFEIYHGNLRGFYTYNPVVG
jgi:hypothetical protein